MIEMSSIAPGPLAITLAITGASGSAVAAEMLRVLESDDRVTRIHLIASPAALRVLAEEAGINGRQDLASRLLGRTSTKTVQHPNSDIGAPVASGSYPMHAMIVLPCSMGTLAGVAHGLANDLIERAADVCLKERRRLVLCVRESPLNLIHIRNMAAAAEAGATIFPLIPTFYNLPQTMEEMMRNYVHRVLAHIGLFQPGAFVWNPDTK